MLYTFSIYSESLLGIVQEEITLVENLVFSCCEVSGRLFSKNIRASECENTDNRPQSKSNVK